MMTHVGRILSGTKPNLFKSLFKTHLDLEVVSQARPLLLARKFGAFYQ